MVCVEKCSKGHALPLYDSRNSCCDDVPLASQQLYIEMMNRPNELNSQPNRAINLLLMTTQLQN